MVISASDLQAMANRVRQAAGAAGELRPARIGPVSCDIPEDIRDAIADDLMSGVYSRAASQAVAGDPDMAQD